ncbi:hypothetical protein HYZ99_05750 [Candidatus Peregrinibacteria bacterium]|nr:hypothetical protein [Candidatus Peregrinibacteria bacterium]
MERIIMPVTERKKDMVLCRKIGMQGFLEFCCDLNQLLFRKINTIRKPGIDTLNESGVSLVTPFLPLRISLTEKLSAGTNIHNCHNQTAGLSYDSLF